MAIDWEYHHYKTGEAFLKAYDLTIKEGLRRMDTFTLALHYAALSNHAFACETYLKCINRIEGTTITRKHKLSLVFKSLSAKSRRSLNKIYNEMMHNPDMGLIDVLEEADLAYERYRYSHDTKHQQNSGESQQYRIDMAIRSIRRYIKELRPEWSQIMKESDFL